MYVHSLQSPELANQNRFLTLILLIQKTIPKSKIAISEILLAQLRYATNDADLYIGA
jgi:hypothetical protein